jgi:hypothetical protein
MANISNISLESLTYTAPSLQQTSKEVFVTTHAINSIDIFFIFIIYAALIFVYYKCLKDENFLFKINKNASDPKVKKRVLHALKWMVRLYPFIVIIFLLFQILAFKTAYGI